MNKLIDVLILVEFDMFNGAVNYFAIHRNIVPEINCDEVRNAKGFLDVSMLPLEFTESCQDLVSLTEFPYDAFKSASNPKVLSIILD
jgi:hypothetical protein